jgi:hypothetical protein
LLLVCWRKSYRAVIDESLKAAVAPNVPHPDCCRSAKEVSLECRRTGAVLSERLGGRCGETVGKPDALVGHVRFDERRRETTGCP